MTFISVAFLYFFVLVTAGYYFCPARFRWALLLVASCYFYAAFVPQYLLVLFALIGVHFLLAQAIEKTRGTVWSARFLVLSIAASVAILFFFKYFNFFNENLSELASFLGWNYSIGALQLLLPLGLSFHTFQSLSYSIEVYRGKYPAETHLGFYALYVMFFPQLVAGPIERPAHLLPQLKRTVNFSGARLESGLRLMAWGFFKKLVIADQLAITVNHVWGSTAQAEGPAVAVAMVFFAFQLYTDFSGYTDIARGSARVLGIELVRNFEQPYFSRSIAEFWRRWHISLSEWFRDYFYYPLFYSARRLSIVWVYLCIVATFLVTGFWHGAGWTYIIMGALFGGYIVGGLITKKWREWLVQQSGLVRMPALHAGLQVVWTFALVCVAWVFFRSPTVGTAFEFLGRLGVGWHMPLGQFLNSYLMQPFFALHISRTVLFADIVFIGLLLAVEYWDQKDPVGEKLDRQPLLVRSFLYTSVVLAILLFGSFIAPPFIYFQF